MFGAFFFFKQKTAYEMRISDWSSDVCSSDLRAWRLGRLRQELKARDYAGALLYDPINIRYACDVRNMQVWCLHNAARYVFVPTEGPVVLFDFHNCAHLSDGNETVAEVRPAVSWFYFAAGSRCRELAAQIGRAHV